MRLRHRIDGRSRTFPKIAVYFESHSGHLNLPKVDAPLRKLARIAFGFVRAKFKILSKGRLFKEIEFDLL